MLNVRVIPRVSRNIYDGIHEDPIRIRIAATPVDGKANAHLMSFISAIFALPKRPGTLISGSTRCIKRIPVDRPKKLPADILR